MKIEVAQSESGAPVLITEICDDDGSVIGVTSLTHEAWYEKRKQIRELAERSYSKLLNLATAQSILLEEK